MRKSSICPKHNLERTFRGGHNRCKACTNEWSRNFYKNNTRLHQSRTNVWRKKNTEINTKIKRRGQLKQYGLDEEKYVKILTIQNNGCAICHTKTPGGRWKVWVVDHKHDGTKNVRGLLCNICNAVLGLVNEDIIRLQSMIKYLKADTNYVT